jgi:hypothetical protein
VTRREAHRLALLVIVDDLSLSLDISDEWTRHPETDVELTLDEVKKVKSEARKIVDELTDRANDLDG